MVSQTYSDRPVPGPGSPCTPGLFGDNCSIIRILDGRKCIIEE